MRGDLETIKERLDIAEVVGGYVKLEKAGQSLKARCPFHNEKTPSFFVSPTRQNYYCFGCGAKGDMVTFVEEMDGLDFRGALKLLADKAGVELEYKSGVKKDEKDKVLNTLETTTQFFENNLEKDRGAIDYLHLRGLDDKTIKDWRLGLALDEWRSLYHHLQSLGVSKEEMLKAGLIKTGDKDKEPYDVFRNRIIFPMADNNGNVIAFSGRALGDVEPKYLNSPDTIVFHKNEVLYGLDKAKNDIRRKNYAVLVEGQMDLLMSYQSGVTNTVATSGTSFTAEHLHRLLRLSPRIILAFDGDTAGEKALEKSAILALSLGLEVKATKMPKDSDPAKIAQESPDKWKDTLRESVLAIEYFLTRSLESEKDTRKLGKLIEKKILPLVALLKSSIEQSHFITLISKRAGIKEEVLWDDLKKVPTPEKEASLTKSSDVSFGEHGQILLEKHPSLQKNKKEVIEERLREIEEWKKELTDDTKEKDKLLKEEAELHNNLDQELLREKLGWLMAELSRAEGSKDNKLTEDITLRVQEVHKKIREIEENKKLL